jgi:Predicted transcriptional regulator with C-terminal CBS domains
MNEVKAMEARDEDMMQDDINNNNKITENIGEKIVKYRKANGISQTYLASKIGISNQGLLKIEKGHTSPRTDTVRKILDALCITPNQLFGTEEINEESLDVLARLRKMDK